MTLMFNGIGVSRGFAIGEAHVLHRDRIDVTARKLTKKQIPAECRRLRKAIKTAKKELLTAKENIPEDAPSDISAFIETHILMLDDTLLSDRPIEIIKTEQCNAEAALQQQRVSMAKVFGAMDDQYLSTRVDDVNHVIEAVLRALHLDAQENKQSTTKKTAAKTKKKSAAKKVTKKTAQKTASTGVQTKPGDAWKGQIIIAEDLSPAETVAMQSYGVAGFVTETGGPLSHTAILARSLGIPAIVGVHNIKQFVVPGETLTLDGDSGLLLAEPSESMLSDLRKQAKALKQQKRDLEKLIDTPSITLDHVELELMANIEIEEDLKALKRVNAAGVGLYRTEFMYLNRDTAPSEQEHLKVYSKVMRALKGAPLTIRTADLGADKESPVFSHQTSNPQTHNPAMGLRGIRLCLNEPAFFITQLRAIFRASAKGPVRILLPMLTNLSEVEQALRIIESVKEQLEEEGVEFDKDIPVGGMIEVPAAAIAAEQFAQRLDFLSIGTNDLIQYTLAIDRIDDQVNYLYDPLHPAVLQLIKHVVDAGAKANIPVALCGDMASDARLVRVLLGLGLSEFSMPPNSLLEVKHSLINSHRVRVRRFATALMKTNDTQEQRKLLERINHG